MAPRDITPTEKHPGLIFALAFESAFKLIVLLVLGAVALSQLVGGWAPLLEWPSSLPVNRAIEDLQPVQWFSLLLMFIAAPLVLPHLFQLLFRENTDGRRLRLVAWAVPIYLLLMALPIMPIFWAGMSLGAPVNPEYFSLGLGLVLEQPWLVWLAFLGGLSAAAGITVLASIALASMALNHLVLPFHKPSFNTDVYRWLLWGAPPADRRGDRPVLLPLSVPRPGAEPVVARHHRLYRPAAAAARYSRPAVLGRRQPQGLYRRACWSACWSGRSACWCRCCPTACISARACRCSSPCRPTIGR